MKPLILYRRIILPYDQFENFDLSTADLVVPYEPIIDNDGNKVVSDGNEYGVYMTDNKDLVDDAYGNLHGDGKSIQNDITIGPDKKKIQIPSVGISYEINTEGIDIRKPQIKSSLRGHYNNGYKGNEWIADKVPASHYQVSRIRIGKDILHEAEDIPIVEGNIEQTQNTARQSIQMRKYRLESLVSELSKMTPMQRHYLGHSELAVLKSIYGADGVKYIDSNNIDTSNNVGRIKQLMAIFYKKGNGTIDFTTLGYIEGLKQKLAKSDDPSLIETLEQIITDDIKINEDKKNAFVQRKTEEGVEFSTSVFDKKDGMMVEILSTLSPTKGEKDISDKDFDERKTEMENHNSQPTKPNRPKIKPSIVDAKTKVREMQIKRALEYQRLLEEQDHGMSM